MFITFEGIDGCGKSIQISKFGATLKEQGIPLVITSEPGGTKIGQAIREILLNVDNTEIAYLTELFLIQADRAQHVREVIKPALDAGKWIICDRYYDATTVYQGIVMGQHEKLIEQLNHEASLGCEPDITFLLDCPAEVGLKRTEQREKTDKKRDRFERKSLDFHVKIRYGYLALAHEHKERFKIIDSTLPEDHVARKIREIISPYLPKVVI
ncbi:MAG: dTMP kinase [Deltaproteobacteria bacterium]|nr:dTMP kinase [Deltaproteobacteria bacterium]MBW2334714.1 dTMP kinase [Deltaproteobacteria bacterium]